MNRPPPIVLPPSAPQSPLRLSAVADAWRMFLGAPAVWAVHALLPSILLSLAGWQGVVTLNAVMDAFNKGADLGPEQLSNFTFALWLNAAGIWSVFFAGAGMLGCVRKQLRGESVGLSDVFSYQGRAGQALLVSGAMTVLIVVGYCCCYVPGLAAEGISMSANFRAVDRREGFGAAFLGSFQRVRAQLLVAGVCVHVLLIVLLIGGCIPFFGYLVGVPLYNISRALFYLRLLDDENRATN